MAEKLFEPLNGYYHHILYYMLKIIAYLIYVIVFTYCYYVLNKKLPNKWIFIIYPLIFVATIIPIKFWVDYARPVYGDVFTKTWLSIMLMTSAGFCLFNFFYGIVNIMVSTQVNFHQKYGNPGLNPVRGFIANASNIKGFLHFFFYTGGVILIGIAFAKY